MIISHKHRFIFIKTRKTAGTSLEAYLARYCGAEDVLTPLVPAVPGHMARNDLGRWNPLPEIAESLARGDAAGLRTTASHWRRRRRFFKHIPASLVRARVGPRVWREYTTFCVERNPFDKALSHYFMLHARGVVTDFDAYLEAGNLCWNAPLYTDHRGHVIVDHILRYENLDAEFGAILDRLQIPYGGRIDIREKADTRPKRAPYRDVLTPRHRRRLEAAFARECALHGYAF